MSRATQAFDSSASEAATREAARLRAEAVRAAARAGGYHQKLSFRNFKLTRLMRAKH